jgi:hypothetical protein
MHASPYRLFEESLSCTAAGTLTYGPSASITLNPGQWSEPRQGTCLYVSTVISA